MVPSEPPFQFFPGDTEFPNFPTFQSFQCLMTYSPSRCRKLVVLSYGSCAPQQCLAAHYDIKPLLHYSPGG